MEKKKIIDLTGIHRMFRIYIYPGYHVYPCLKFLLFSLIFFLCSSFLLFPACQGRLFKKPEITLQKIEVSSVSLKEINVNLTADIYNPNLMDFEIEKFLYKIKIEGNELVDGELKERVKVKAKGNAPFTVSARIGIDRPDFWNTALKVLNGDKVSYQIKGSVSLNTSIGKKNLNIDNTGEYMLKK